MAWNIDRVLSYSLSGSPQEGTSGIAFDGRDVWVSFQTRVAVLGYWDENSGYEGLYGGSYPRTLSPSPSLYEYADIDLSAYLTGSPQESLGDIVHCNGKMYVAVTEPYDTVVLPDVTVNRTTLVKIIVLDVATKAYDSTINVTVSGAAPEIVAQNNKIWFTDLAQAEDDAPDTQKLYYYDISGASFSSGTTMPVRKQFQDRALINGRDSWVIVSTDNENGIMKFNDSTGSHVSTIITNRDPTALYVNGSREVLVGSADGMVNSVNQTTEAVTAPYGVHSLPTGGLVETGNYLWVAAPGLGRLDKTVGSPVVDNYRLFTDLNTEDYAINSDSFTEKTFNKILLTEQFDYEYYEGGSPAFSTRTVRPYVFLLSDNYVYAFRTGALYRTNTINIRCTAMIGTGPKIYYGETTE